MSQHVMFAHWDAQLEHRQRHHGRMWETMTQVPSANMDREGFMDCSAASLKQEASVVSGALTEWHHCSAGVSRHKAKL